MNPTPPLSPLSPISRRRFAATTLAGLATALAPRGVAADACIYPPRGTLAYTVRQDGAEAGGVTFAFDLQDGAFVALKTVRIVRRRGGRATVRLRQKVQEVWVDGWLHALRARTEREDGTTTLEGERRDRGLSLVRGDGARFNVAGYILTDTLWHRDTPYERGLLDVESGHLRLMRGYPRGRQQVAGFDGRTNARHFVIRGEIGLEVWYDDRCRLVRAAYRTPDGRSVQWVPRPPGVTTLVATPGALSHCSFTVVEITGGSGMPREKLTVQTGETEREEFELRRFDDPLPHEPGVYLVSRRDVSADGTPFHKVFYVGDADDLADRIARHRGNFYFRSHGADWVAVLPVRDPDRRRVLRGELSRTQQPPYSAEEIRLADQGKSALLGVASR